MTILLWLAVALLIHMQAFFNSFVIPFQQIGVFFHTAYKMIMNDMVRPLPPVPEWQPPRPSYRSLYTTYTSLIRQPTRYLMRQPTRT